MTESNLLFLVPRSIYALRQEAEIMKRMNQHGCDAKFINEGEKGCQQVQSLGEQQEDAHRKAKEATQTLWDTRQYIHDRYMLHLKLSRVALKDDAAAAEKLGFKGIRKTRLNEWLRQTNQFYRHALEYAETLEKYNIPRHELEESKTLLGQLIELSALQQKAQSQAQLLTQKKQESLTQLERWYRRLIRVAHIALEDEPQQLEALGVVV